MKRRLRHSLQTPARQTRAGGRLAKNTASVRASAELIKALANPIRLRLMRELRDAELTASDLVRLCGVSKANLSQHINLLKREGLVACAKRGTFCHYSIGDRRVLRALDLLAAVLNARDTGKRPASKRRRSAR